MQMPSLVKHYKNAFSGLSAGTWAFSLVLFVQRSGTMVLPFLTLHLKDHLGVASTIAPLVLAVYGLGAVGGSIIGGHLVSRIGAVRVLVFGMVLVAPCYLALLNCSSVGGVVASVLAMSLIGDSVRPAAMTATANFCNPGQISRAYALNRLAINLGMSIGPAIAGFLYQDHFAWIFYINAATSLAGAALVVRLFGWPQVPMTSAKAKRSRGSIAADRILLGVLGLFLLSTTVFLQSLGVLPIYLRDTHAINESTIGLLFSINTVLIVLFEMLLISWLADTPRLPCIAVGSVLICIGFGCLPWCNNIGLVCGAVVIWTVGEMLAMPLLSTWISERVLPEQRGPAMGAMAAVFSLGWVIAPSLGAFASRISPNFIWYIALFFSALSAIGYYVLIRLDKRRPRDFVELPRAENPLEQDDMLPEVVA